MEISQDQNPEIFAVIPAGGVGKRMNERRPKTVFNNL